jgi:hypothetical protein
MIAILYSIFWIASNLKLGDGLMSFLMGILVLR